MIGLRQRNEDIFEDRWNGAQRIHLAAFVSNFEFQPAEDILSFVLTNTDMQSISEGLNVFNILILARNVTKKIQW
jgi:hypothetical protein